MLNQGAEPSLIHEKDSVDDEGLVTCGRQESSLQSSFPLHGGAVTFKFTKPQGSDAQGSDISVSFDKYVCGEERDTAYLGSVAIWR